MDRQSTDHGQDAAASGGAAGADRPDDSSSHPEQEHPVQDAHGGSMAPGLVDDTGNLVADVPGTDHS